VTGFIAEAEALADREASATWGQQKENYAKQGL
jgi:hypothetical protein